MAYLRKKVEELPEAPSAPSEAPGVAYVENAAAPGLKFFRCEPLKANLSMKGCGSRWREAQVAPKGDLADRLAHCRGCPIGALHAGYKPVRYSPWFGSEICPRCGKGTTRMIGNRQCVSCYNRSRELRNLKNGRGNLPIKLMQRPLRTVELLADIDGEVRRIRAREVSGMAEAMVQVLRTTKDVVAFGWAGRGEITMDPNSLPPTETPAGQADADTVAEVDAESMWEITENRCRGCRGRILRNAADPAVCRCADCGGEGEGDAEDSVEAGSDTGGATVPAPGFPGRPYAFRVWLLGTSALQATRPQANSGHSFVTA